MISNITGAATGVMVVVLTYLAWPIAPFMEVHEMRVSGNQVVISRTVSDPIADAPDIDRELGAIADWQVTVVGLHVDAPSCQTVTGPALHQGWSRYLPGDGEAIMHIDVWVGQPGCYDRLTPGAYDMFVTWTPRDGRDPVTAKTSFEVPSQKDN